MFLNSRTRPAGQDVKEHQHPDLSWLLPTFQGATWIFKVSLVWVCLTWGLMGYRGFQRACQDGCESGKVAGLPSVQLTDGGHVNQAVSQMGNGQVVWLQFTLSVYDRGTQRSFRQERKERRKKFTPPLPSLFPPLISTFIFSSFPLTSEVRSIATRGQHEFRKNSSFL